MKRLCSCGECDQQIEIVRKAPIGLVIPGLTEVREDFRYIEHQMLTGGRRCPNSGNIPDDFPFALGATLRWGPYATMGSVMGFKNFDQAA